MGWINCANNGGSWVNIWHLSPNNANTPRNPAIWLNMSGRYIHACYTNGNNSNGNVWTNTDSNIINWDTWYHLT